MNGYAGISAVFGFNCLIIAPSAFIQSIPFSAFPD